MSSRLNRTVLYVLAGCALAAIALGLHARLRGLGERPLAEDEYYFARTVQFILEKGVPQYPTGGYYPRSLPLLYTEALTCRILGDNELAHRLPTALAGIFLLPLFYGFARSFLPRAYAVGATVLLALSAWEIEFSRFARMYILFQGLTIGFFWAYHAAYIKGSRRIQYLPHALALAALTIHQLAVFLLPFLLVPAVLQMRFGVAPRVSQRNWRFAGATALSFIVALAYQELMDVGRAVGVADRLPEGFQAPGRPLVGGDAAFPFVDAISSPMQVVLIGAVLAGIAAVIVSVRSRENVSTTALPFGLSLLFITALLHLLAAFALVLVVLIWRYDLHLILWRERKTALAFAVACLPAIGWIARAALNPSWTETVAAGDLFKAIRLTFFGLPDFYVSGVHLWLSTTPVIAALLGLGCAGELVRVRKEPWVQVFSSPAALPAYYLLIIGTFNPEQHTTRYWFFVYPFLLLGAVIAFRHAVGWVTARLLPNAEPAAAPVAAAAAVLLFLGTEDFHFKQLVRPNASDIVFRTGEYQRFERHWYPRDDEKSPAEFLNQHAADNDPIIVSGHLTPIAYYFDPDVRFAFYLPRTEDFAVRYAYKSRNEGTAELWTGFPLLGTSQELEVYTGRATRLYLVRMIKPRVQDCNPAEMWGDRLLSAGRVFLSSDGRIEVMMVALAASGS